MRVGHAVVLEASKLQLLCGDLAIDVARPERDLLQRMIECRGDWVSSNELAYVLGRRDPAGLMLVWQHLSRLKKKLARAALTIEHRRNVGYRLP